MSRTRDRSAGGRAPHPPPTAAPSPRSRGEKGLGILEGPLPLAGEGGAKRRVRASRCLRLILRVTPREDRIENRGEEDEAEGEAGALAEIAGQPDDGDDEHDDVHKWYQHQDDPPHRLAGDL